MLLVRVAARWHNLFPSAGITKGKKANENQAVLLRVLELCPLTLLFFWELSGYL